MMLDESEFRVLSWQECQAIVLEMVPLEHRLPLTDPRFNCIEERDWRQNNFSLGMIAREVGLGYGTSLYLGQFLNGFKPGKKMKEAQLRRLSRLLILWKKGRVKAINHRIVYLDSPPEKLPEPYALKLMPRVQPMPDREEFLKIAPPAAARMPMMAHVRISWDGRPSLRIGRPDGPVREPSIGLFKCMDRIRRMK